MLFNSVGFTKLYLLTTALVFTHTNGIFSEIFAFFDVRAVDFINNILSVLSVFSAVLGASFTSLLSLKTNSFSSSVTYVFSVEDDSLFFLYAYFKNVMNAISSLNKEPSPFT